MISREELLSLGEEQRKEVARNRRGLKAMYCTESGSEQFINMARACGLFDKVNVDEVEKIGARNLMADICLAMGMFDEDFIRLMLENLAGRPDLPEKR